MILPLGDQPNPRGTPWMTWVIIALNCAVYLLVSLPGGQKPADPNDPLFREYVEVVSEYGPPGLSPREIAAQTSEYDLVVFRYGFRPAEASLLTLFTAMFLHGGFMHLFGNMLFLWIYGDNVEHKLGKGPYLLWYLATGVAATFFFMLFDVDSPLPMVGASGAISGVLGFYFLWFPRNRVRLWVFFFPFLMDVILLPARVVLGFYLVVDNLLPFIIMPAGGGGVAHGAHIGGFVAGLGVALVYDRRQLFGRPKEFDGATPAAGAQETLDEPDRGALSTLIASGRFEEAAAAYFAHAPADTGKLLAPTESLALGDWLARNAHAQAALVVYLRHLRDYPSGPGAAEAHVGAGMVQLRALQQPTPAYQHFLDALDLGASPETAAIAREGLDEIARLQKYRLAGR